MTVESTWRAEISLRLYATAFPWATYIVAPDGTRRREETHSTAFFARLRHRANRRHAAYLTNASRPGGALSK